jgi:hypothetical protein
MNPVANTVNWLKLCQRARAEGYPVAYTTDPAWLVNVAVNRRANWPDDPSFNRGSCRPTTDGRFPPKAGGDYYRHLWLASRQVNSRVILRPQSLGECRALIEKRISYRLEYTE